MEKITEQQMFGKLRLGSTLLEPLVLRSCQLLGKGPGEADMRIELALPGESQGYQFVVEAKSRSTPQAVEQAMARATHAAGDGEIPMIYVPYLSPERLTELEHASVCGVDLCGNGLVIVPNRIWILRTGNPNQFHDSRPLNNPFRGRSALVARILLTMPEWGSLTELAASVHQMGGALSLPQASKAVSALEDERIVHKSAGTIKLADPLRMLDELGVAWSPPVGRRQSLHLSPQVNVAAAFNSAPLLKWAVTGESSVRRHVTFAQGGPRKIAVSDLELAFSLLDGTPESIPNFATVELLEADEPGFYFGNEVDDDGTRWASPLQTWLELNSGDARQQAAARDLRKQILKQVRQSS